MAATDSNTDLPPPPPYSSLDRDVAASSFPDPRSSSSLSLGNAAISDDGRRRLLLVYVHGFMGNETSFQHFPAHVHNMVTALLSQSHTVHSKIYPRYRSKKSIGEAAQALGAWLQPHATSDTDVVLLGHSMGGLLLAETVLLPFSTPTTTSVGSQVLGTINFDTPFLGMHPGIIKAGLGSIFRGGDELPPASGGPKAREIMDPNYNPAFFNDTRLPVRSAWRNAAHFVNKHSQNLTAATRQAVTSHIDFGKCLADYDGLKVRYCKIRMLEDDDVVRRRTVVQNNEVPPRIRFVNYYTASTGRPSQPRSPAKETSRQGSTTSLDPEIPRERYGSVAEARSIDSATSRPPEKVPVVVEDSDEETVVSDLSDLDPLEDVDTRFDEMTIVDNASIRSTAKRPVDGSIARKAVPAYSVEVSASPNDIGPGVMPPPFTESTSTPEDPLDFDPFQPGLPSEPEPLQPPPSAMQFDDQEKYRAELHLHGASSKEYFKDRKAHQKALYEKFMAESKAKTDECHATIKQQYALIAAESKRVAEAAAENVRIMVEIQNEEVQSLQEHRKLVAEYRKQRGPATNPKVTAMLDKADKKLSEKQAKVAKKAQQERNRMQHKQAKIQRKMLGKPGCSHKGSSTSTDTPSLATSNSFDDESTVGDDSFFDATKQFTVQDNRAYEQELFDRDARGHQIGLHEALWEGPSTASKQKAPLSAAPQPMTGYDMETAPIANSIYALQDADINGSNASTPSFLTPSVSSSQTSLSTDPASGSFSYDALSPNALTPQTSTAPSESDAVSRTSTPKPNKDKKFCNLPPADASGQHDPTWVRIYMENVDEVGAHCGLFFSNAPSDGPTDAQGWSERYARLVGEVSERIEGWVGEDMTRRAVEMLGEQES